MTNEQSSESSEGPRDRLDASEALVQDLKDLDPVEAVSPTAGALTILERELGGE